MMVKNNQTFHQLPQQRYLLPRLHNTDGRADNIVVMEPVENLWLSHRRHVGRGALVQWLKLPAWNVGDRVLE